MRITLEDIFGISTAVIYYPDRYKSVTSVSIDTRTIKKNSIFVAIKGGNYDGHKFVKDAINKGAIAVVVSNRKLKNFDNVQVPIISVKNTLIKTEKNVSCRVCVTVGTPFCCCQPEYDAPSYAITIL